MWVVLGSMGLHHSFTGSDSQGGRSCGGIRVRWKRLWMMGCDRGSDKDTVEGVD